MNVATFRRKLTREYDLTSMKIRGTNIIDVAHDGTVIFSITEKEIQEAQSIDDILNRMLRAEYIPPLG